MTFPTVEVKCRYDNERMCDNKQCVYESRICDGRANCDDGTDEKESGKWQGSGKRVGNVK